ncbi:MAG: zinc ribbon domain-containing protein [Ruminococcaceae bacterium]|nr:zinc ribbon domain-containing protein [Oscillospiraceae bacterium]
MSDIMKKITAPMAYIGLGVLNIIFMCLNFMTSFSVYNGDFNLAEEGLSAFKSMKFGDEAVAKLMELLNFDLSFFMYIVALLLILFLIFNIALILVGTVLLLRDKANVDFGSLDLSKVEELFGKAFFANFLAVVVIGGISEFVYLINLITGDGVFAGFCPGIGYLLLLALAIAVFVLTKKFGLGSAEVAAAGMTYKCEACGAKAKATEKFCPKCGGNVVALATPVYKCSACGAKAKASDKFCAKCGGAVIETAPVTYKCSACGAKAKETDKFCGKCGAAVIAEEAKIDTEVNQ